MTYEKGLFAQADPGIVSGSTIEKIAGTELVRREADVLVCTVSRNFQTNVRNLKTTVTVLFNSVLIGRLF